MSNFYFCDNCNSLFSPATSASLCNACLYGKNKYIANTSAPIRLSPGFIEIRAIDYQTQYINIQKEEDTKQEYINKYLESYNKL